MEIWVTASPVKSLNKNSRNHAVTETIKGSRHDLLASSLLVGDPSQLDDPHRFRRAVTVAYGVLPVQHLHRQCERLESRRQRRRCLNFASQKSV